MPSEWLASWIRASNYNVRKNGVSVVSTTPSWGISTDLTLFAETPWLNGDIAEVILYNRELTPTEIGTVEAYLNAKYGLY